MACEHCPGDGDESKCSVCNMSRFRDLLDWKENQDEYHRQQSRRYSQTVSVVCLVVLVVITVTAGICAAVNTFGGKH